MIESLRQRQPTPKEQLYQVVKSIREQYGVFTSAITDYSDENNIPRRRELTWVPAVGADADTGAPDWPVYLKLFFIVSDADEKRGDKSYIWGGGPRTQHYSAGEQDVPMEGEAYTSELAFLVKCFEQNLRDPRVQTTFVRDNSPADF